jgi:hypothetical protein
MHLWQISSTAISNANLDLRFQIKELPLYAHTFIAQKCTLPMIVASVATNNIQSSGAGISSVYLKVRRTWLCNSRLYAIVNRVRGVRRRSRLLTLICHHQTSQQFNNLIPFSKAHLSLTQECYSPKPRVTFLEVKEMDKIYSHGFKSSFMQHHVASSPNVSAIPSSTQSLLVDLPKEEEEAFIANLPTDGPEVCFMS